MDDRVAGERLRRHVRVKMAERQIDSLSELAVRADVGRDTLQAWMRGRSISPKSGEKVARALGESYMDLLNARDGAAYSVARPLSDEDVERIARRLAEIVAPEMRGDKVPGE